MITALRNFNKAYDELLSEWQSTDLNATDSISYFPFAANFDELDIFTWVEETVSELQHLKYKIVSHYYENTGGNCMVSVFEVELPLEKRTLYVNVGEYSIGLYTHDFISTEVEFDISCLLYDCTFEELKPNSDYFELFKYCVIEYLKKDCKRFDYAGRIPYELLTDEMQQSLDPVYVEWQRNNNMSIFETNGYTVIIDEEYKDLSPDAHKALELMLRMKTAYDEWMDNDDDDCKEKFYDMYATIGFGHFILTFSNNADIYTSMMTMLQGIVNDG